MTVSTLKDRYSQYSSAQPSFPDKPGKGELQGGAQKLAAFPRLDFLL